MYLLDVAWACHVYPVPQNHRRKIYGVEKYCSFSNEGQSEGHKQKQKAITWLVLVYEMLYATTQEDSSWEVIFPPQLCFIVAVIPSVVD